MLIVLNQDLYEMKSAVAGHDFHEEMKGKLRMVLGEGLVFVIILIAGVAVIQRNMRRELRLADMEKTFLLSTSHELKTPVATIRLVLETLLRKEPGAEQSRQLLNNALHETDRLQDLTENILMASRIDHDAGMTHFESINMGVLVQDEVKRKLVALHDERKIIVSAGHHLFIRADKHMIHILLSNLLDNAIKYSPANSRIEVELAEVPDALLLQVKDHGSGIPRADRPLVFEKFFRGGDEAVRRHKGTGLGLYLVKQIAAIHGAMVSISDNQPQGSIFEIRFPTNQTN